MHWYNYLITILLSGFIGWAIIRLSIIMLFRPRKPRRFFGFTIQGVFPKSQKRIAAIFGGMVSDDLLTFIDLEQRFTSQENLNKIKPEIEKHFDRFLTERFKHILPVLSKFIGTKTTQQLRDSYMQELEILLPQLITQYISQLKNDVNLAQMVADKVSAFSVKKLEEVLLRIMTKEFQFLEVVGALFGCLIGGVQVVLNILTHS
jgi:uncharacterized membrane protein YheB (UPF0754 family)